MVLPLVLASGCGIFGELDWGIRLKPGIKLTYDINGGGGTAPQDTTNYNTGDRLTVQAGPEDGVPPSGAVDFYGWSTTADGYGTFYPAGAAFTITKNTTLYALWQGDGTDTDRPKLGSTKDDLLAMGSGDNFALVSDVDNMDEPIPAILYRGAFDGRGHTVTLNINKSGTISPNQIGLFRVVTTTAVIKNVHVTGSITIDNSGWTPLWVGGVVADSLYGTITLKNCMSSVNITVATTGAQSRLGGLVGGSGEGVSVEHCYYSGDISFTFTGGSTGYRFAGGIAGTIGETNPVAGTVSNTVSLSNITWSETVAYDAAERGVRRITGGVPYSLPTANFVFANNYGLGTMTMRSGGSPAPQAVKPAFEGDTVTMADIEDEAWWRETAGWESVWGGENPAPDKPWEWDAVNKRPKLHVFD